MQPYEHSTANSLIFVSILKHSHGSQQWSQGVSPVPSQCTLEELSICYYVEIRAVSRALNLIGQAITKEDHVSLPTCFYSPYPYQGSKFVGLAPEND